MTDDRQTTVNLGFVTDLAGAWQRTVRDYRLIGSVERRVLCVLSVVTVVATSLVVATASYFLNEGPPVYVPPQIPDKFLDPVIATLKAGEQGYARPNCLYVNLEGKLFLFEECTLRRLPEKEFDMRVYRTQTSSWGIDCTRCWVKWTPDDTFYMHDIPVAHAEFAEKYPNGR